MEENVPQLDGVLPRTSPVTTRKRPLNLTLFQDLPDIRSRATSRQVERSKVSRACDACKKRKTRCSGRRPCIRCQEWRIPCTYTAVYTRGRLPEIPGASGTSPNIADVEHCEGISTNRSSDISLRPQSKDAPFDDGPVPWTGHSSRRSSVPNAEVEGQYHGPSSPLTFLERAWKRLKRNHVSTFVQNLESETSEQPEHVNTSHAGSLDDSSRFPLQQHALELIERYFEIATPFYRFFHRGVVESWAKLVYPDSSGSLNLHRRSLAGKKAALLMIFAEATFYGQDNSEEDSFQKRWSQSKKYSRSAYQYLQDDIGSPNLESIQARLVECFHLLSTPRANEVYSKFGMLVSMAITIGLHRQKRRHGYKHQAGLLEHECRKRSFWAIYILDRYLSVMGGRPRLLLDLDHDQDLPASLDDEVLTFDGVEPRTKSSDSVIDAPNAHAKLAGIIGRTSHDIYPLQPPTLDESIVRLQRSTKALRDWKNELPILFRGVAPSCLLPVFRRQSIIIHIAHAHAVIHANRPVLLNQFSDTNSYVTGGQTGFKSYIDDCVSAALGVLEALECFAEEDNVFLTLWFVQYVSFCAIAVIYIFIVLRHQQRDAQPLATPVAGSPECTSPNEYLSIAELWQCRLAEVVGEGSPGRKYNMILEELRHEVHRHQEPRDVETGATMSTSDDGMQGQDPSGIAEFDFEDGGNGDFAGLNAENSIDLMQILDSWGLPEWAQFDCADTST